MRFKALQNKIAEYSLKLCQTKEPEIICLGGHASYRIYYRVTGNSKSFIIMELSKETAVSEEICKSQNTDSKIPFIDIQKYLEKSNFSVPKVFAYLEKDGLLLLEDLGDQTLESTVINTDNANLLKYYTEAVNDLITLQKYSLNGGKCVCFNREFDFDLLKWELDHFTEWFINAFKNAQLTNNDSCQIEKYFSQIANEICQLPQILVHRDYQCRNIMVQEHSADFRLRHIDFQDALMGPLPYDLVALLRDSYIDLEIDLVEELIHHYLDNSHICISKDEFFRAFWLQTIQRKLKDTGRFVYIDHIKKNPTFLKHIPLSLKYVKHALKMIPEFEELRHIIGKYVAEIT